MNTLSDLIKTVFGRSGNRPEYLDLPRMNARMRADLGLGEMAEPDRLQAARDAGGVQRGRYRVSISFIRRNLI